MNRLIILLVSLAVLVVLYLSGGVAILSEKSLDVLFRIRGPIPPSEEIVIVGIDETSIDALGSWPFPREYHIELLHKLAQARAIGFDILFSEQGFDDARFSAAMAKAPPVVLATAHDYQHHPLKPARSLHGYASLGHIEIILNREGVVRKCKLQQQVGKKQYTTFGAALLASTNTVKDLSGYGDSILINYYGPEISFLYLPYIDLLSGAIPEDFFKDRFVLVGAQALDIGDSHITPFSNEYQTPGVEIQATILNNLLDGSALQKMYWPIVLFMLLTTFTSIFIWPRLEERWNWLFNGVLLAAMLFISTLFFKHFLFVSPVLPILFLILSFTLHLVTERIENATKIIREVRRLDEQLATQLQRVYTNIPHFFTKYPAPRSAKGFKRYLSHLQAGVNVLNLQHHFIEKILREKLLPYILWDQENGEVILANNLFTVFWQQHFSDESALPPFKKFAAMIATHDLQQEKDSPTIDEMVAKRQNILPLDIGIKKAGLLRYYRLNIQLLEVIDVEFCGVLAILTDVTEIKELERLKDKIVSIVSHELKLPLTVIRGYAEMLAETLHGEEKEFIDEVCTQSDRLHRLIEEFLDVARIEHNRQQIKRLPLALIPLIEEAKDMMTVPATKKSIHIHAKLPFKATPILGDYSLLFQAVVNLLDNAVKFSPDNTEVTISLVEEVNHFLLTVDDQGPGVPHELQKEIFESFSRGQMDVVEDGFGLGLSFVKQVVEKHHGEVWVESKEEDGSCFCVRLVKEIDT